MYYKCVYCYIPLYIQSHRVYIHHPTYIVYYILYIKYTLYVYTGEVETFTCKLGKWLAAQKRMFYTAGLDADKHAIFQQLIDEGMYVYDI